MYYLINSRCKQACCRGKATDGRRLCIDITLLARRTHRAPAVLSPRQDAHQQQGLTTSLQDTGRTGGTDSSSASWVSACIESLTSTAPNDLDTTTAGLLRWLAQGPHPYNLDDALLLLRDRLKPALAGLFCLQGADALVYNLPLLKTATRLRLWEQVQVQKGCGTDAVQLSWRQSYKHDNRWLERLQNLQLVTAFMDVTLDVAHHLQDRLGAQSLLRVFESFVALHQHILSDARAAFEVAHCEESHAAGPFLDLKPLLAQATVHLKALQQGETLRVIPYYSQAAGTAHRPTSTPSASRNGPEPAPVPEHSPEAGPAAGTVRQLLGLACRNQHRLYNLGLSLAAQQEGLALLHPSCPNVSPLEADHFVERGLLLAGLGLQDLAALALPVSAGVTPTLHACTQTARLWTQLGHRPDAAAGQCFRKQLEGAAHAKRSHGEWNEVVEVAWALHAAGVAPGPAFARLAATATRHTKELTDACTMKAACMAYLHHRGLAPSGGVPPPPPGGPPLSPAIRGHDVEWSCRLMWYRSSCKLVLATEVLAECKLRLKYWSVDAFLAALEGCLPLLTPAELAALLVALIQLDARPGQHWMRQYMAAVHGSRRLMRPASLAQILLALPVFVGWLSPEWVGAMVGDSGGADRAVRDALRLLGMQQLLEATQGS